MEVGMHMEMWCIVAVDYNRRNDSVRQFPSCCSFASSQVDVILFNEQLKPAFVHSVKVCAKPVLKARFIHVVSGVDHLNLFSCHVQTLPIMLSRTSDELCFSYTVRHSGWNAKFVSLLPSTYTRSWQVSCWGHFTSLPSIVLCWLEWQLRGTKGS